MAISPLLSELNDKSMLPNMDSIHFIEMLYPIWKLYELRRYFKYVIKTREENERKDVAFVSPIL